jgi:medium-chain acyl-[acyl-carrier-protein] hydrolase
VSVNKWFPGLKRRPGARLQLFCFPFAGGGASAFRGWQDQLPAWTELWPLEYPGHETRFRDPSFDSAIPLADAICTELAAVIDLPFALFGHSMGGLLAFETARALRRRFAMDPAALFVAGHAGPQLLPFRPPIRDLPEPQFRQELRVYGGTPNEVLANEDLMQFLSPLLRRDLGICETYAYTPEPKLSFPIIAFGGAEDPTVPWDRVLQWLEQTSAGFRAYIMPGEHFFIRKAAPSICKIISRQLEDGESLNRILPPTAEEAHLWKVDIEIPQQQVAALRTLLSPDELQRADAFVQAPDRARYTVTRAALRILLGRYGNLSPERIEFSYSAHGKPSCPKLQPIEFNIAHSGSFGLMAITRGQSVGVDIERIRALPDVLAIGKQVFTFSELNALAQRPPDQQLNSFFDLWSRKEAYLKCSGEGFMGSPETVHVGLPAASGFVPPASGQLHSASPNRPVQSFRPAVGYAAAIAVGRGWDQIVFRDWKFDSF